MPPGQGAAAPAARPGQGVAGRAQRGRLGQRTQREPPRVVARWRSTRRAAARRSTGRPATPSAQRAHHAATDRPKPVVRPGEPPAGGRARRRRDTRVLRVPLDDPHRARRGRRSRRAGSFGEPRGGCPVRPRRIPARTTRPASAGPTAATGAPRRRTPPPAPGGRHSARPPPGAAEPAGARCSGRPGDPCRTAAEQTRTRHSAAHGRRHGCPPHAVRGHAAGRRPGERHGARGPCCRVSPPHRYPTRGPGTPVSRTPPLPAWAGGRCRCA